MNEKKQGTSEVQKSAVKREGGLGLLQTYSGHILQEEESTWGQMSEVDW